jgi:hypothetical protein
MVSITPRPLYPGKIPYTRLGALSGRPGFVRKTSPLPGLVARKARPLKSVYTDYATQASTDLKSNKIESKKLFYFGDGGFILISVMRVVLTVLF